MDYKNGYMDRFSRINLKIDGKPRTIYGGPFFNRPFQEDIITINLMKEFNLPSDIYIPIQDFSVPENITDFINAFNLIRNSDKDIYVGCFGGIGRTGLFMSCLAKYFGHTDAINFVRENYNTHAVETESQMEYFELFPVLEKPSIQQDQTQNITKHSVDSESESESNSNDTQSMAEKDNPVIPATNDSNEDPEPNTFFKRLARVFK